MIPRTLVIPLGGGSLYQNLELRYALRSWEIYFGLEEVIIVGEKPEWLDGVMHVPFHKLRPTSKPREIFDKVMIAARLVPEFIFANDDHFLLKPLINLPYYHCGKLRSFKGGSDTFMRYVGNTTSRFPEGNYFDIHTPMVVNSEIVKNLQYGQKDVLFKSLYCNTAGIEGEYLRDLKIGSHVRADEIDGLMESRPFFSTSDVISNDLRKWIQSKYSNPSRWE